MYLLTLSLLPAFVSATSILLQANNLDSRLANIHLSPRSGEVDVAYGSCDNFTALHHIIKRSVNSSSSRLVWLIPDDVPLDGCLTAWENGQLVGKSEGLSFLKKRNILPPIPMDNSTGIDTRGPWFDGVMHLKDRPISEVDEKTAKKKKIGIVGGGPAGLMTALLLQTAGFKNWEILESSNRLGGRIRTVYLEGEPGDYQYQEMGPMRFPYEIQYAGSNEKLEINDHKIVFQLAEYLNKLNKNDPKLSIKFIEFIQNNANAPNYLHGIKNPDGGYVTVSEAMSDPRFSGPSNPVQEQIFNTVLAPQKVRELAKNMFQAHKNFIASGLDGWSETQYVHKALRVDLDTTDSLGLSYKMTFWYALFDLAYFSNTVFKTIDYGLERLAVAFSPHVKRQTRFSTRVEAMKTDHGKVQLFWRQKFDDKNLRMKEYDYAMISAPFTQVRQWHLPTLTNRMTRAISNLNYGDACKVALQFKTRFWEHLPKPIFGGCTSTDIPGVGNFCYPSYGLNSTGPGVLLASYSMVDDAIRQVALTDKEQVQKTLNAMAEIHGDVVYQQYTGKFSRHCWINDPHIAAGWAEPSAGQHEMFIPEYFKTINGTIFIGEHTSYTHAWIASAFESAIRGTVQLCLELGLVDEAKEITKTWMARWISL
ncbi:flavin-containing amine oxidoreductase-domain containing protein [Pyronema domesticum]|nr:flavin-containing amine oxidoreductase-domain containing protein [Pyronema domesticum]